MRFVYLSILISSFTIAMASQANAMASVCSRSQSVRRGIETALGLSCNQIKQSDLKNVRSLYLKEVHSLRSGDFKALQNLSYLQITGGKISGLADGVFDGASLELLSIANTRLSKVTRAGLKHLPFLETLLLGYNQIREIEPGAFDQLEKLRSLNLNKNKITVLGKNTFSDQVLLKDLNLSHNQIGAIDAEAFSHMHRITALNLQLNDNQISILPADAFKGLRAFGHLDLANNLIEALPPSIFHGLWISALQLEGNSVSDVDASVFDLREVEINGYVSLRSNPLSDATKSLLKTQLGNKVEF